MIRAILNYILRASEYDLEKTRGDVLYKGYIDSTHRIKELEAERDYLDTKCAAFENDFVLLDVTEKLKKAEARIVELEIHNKDFHLACINALDLHRESDVPKLKDIPNIIEEIRERNQKLEIQLKSKDIIINNQQGGLNYYATKDLFRGNNE